MLCVAGVPAKLKETGPSSLLVHCSNYSVDLVLQEIAREVCLFADTQSFIQGVSVVIEELPKQKTLFPSSAVRMWCATFWVCVRLDGALESHLSVCSSYPVLLKILKMLEQDKTVRTETRHKIHTGNKGEDTLWLSELRSYC